MITVRLNGKLARLAIDTGSPTTMLDQKETWPYHDSSRTSDSVSVEVGEVKVGLSAQFADNPAIQNSRENHVDGLLGRDFLGFFTFGLDLGAHEFRICDRGETAEEAISEWPHSGSGIGEIKQLRGAFHDGFYCSPVTIQGKNFDAVVDTGSAESSLTPESLAGLGPVKCVGLGNAVMFQSNLLWPTFAVSSMAMDGVDLKPPPQVLALSASLPKAVVVGEDILGQMRIAFDAVGNDIAFQPLHRFKASEVAPRQSDVAANLAVGSEWIPIIYGSQVYYTNDAPLPPLVLSPFTTINLTMAEDGSQGTCELVPKKPSDLLDSRTTAMRLGDISAQVRGATTFGKPLTFTRGSLILIGKNTPRPLVHFDPPYQMHTDSVPGGIEAISEEVDN